MVHSCFNMENAGYKTKGGFSKQKTTETFIKSAQTSPATQVIPAKPGLTFPNGCERVI